MSIIKINQGEKNEKVIGFADEENRVFKKTVLASKHLFRKYDSFGIDALYFTNILLARNYKIIVWEKEENIVYEITAKKFKEKGFFFTFKGHGSQIFCARKNWDKIKKDNYDARETSKKYFL